MKASLIFLIRLYQYTLGTIFPPACRFQLTCSQYGIESIRKYGAIKGVRLLLWRLLRCHPFSRGGDDPVL